MDREFLSFGVPRSDEKLFNIAKFFDPRVKNLILTVGIIERG